MKYKTILADPPWNEFGGGKIRRGANKHYPLMKTKQIIGMVDFIKSLSAENCHLYLWTTNNFLPDALEVMKAWGFNYKTIITWVKGEIQEDLVPDFKQLFTLQKPGLGQYFRGLTEHCLFGVKGVLPYKVFDGKRSQGKTVFIAPRTIHSKKPYDIHYWAERVSYPPYIELFAREEFPCWDSWRDSVLIRGKNETI